MTRYMVPDSIKSRWIGRILCCKQTDERLWVVGVEDYGGANQRITAIADLGYEVSIKVPEFAEHFLIDYEIVEGDR